MRTAGRRTLVLALLAMGLCWGRPASAQTDEEFFQTFPFNFSNPGARAQAMGGAFVAIADDASAAVANPAGLTFLTRQQAYLEYKNLYAPVAELTATNSLLGGISPLVGNRISLPGFFNFARPINDKMTIAVSMHDFLSYKNDFHLAARNVIQGTPYFPSLDASVDLKAYSYSGAIGYLVNPKLRVGAAASINHLSAAIDANRNCSPVAGKCSTANIPSTSINQSVNAPAFTGGVMFQASESISLGAVYAYEPKFKVTEQTKAGQTYPGAAASDTSWTVPFNTPSHLGGGISWRMNDRMLAAFDASYVQYSQLLDGQQLVLFRHAESYTQFGGACTGFGAACADPTLFHIDNGVDLHGGVEVEVVKAPVPVFLRYGLFRAAPHSVTYSQCTGPQADIHSPAYGGFPCGPVGQLYTINAQAVGITGFDAQGKALGDIINLTAPEKGVSFGAGFVIGPRTQFDLAFVHTSYRRTEIIASSAVRF